MRETAFVVSPGAPLMGLAAMSVFECANLISGAKLYRMHVLSEDGGLVRTSLGMAIDTRRFLQPRFDTVIVTGIAAPAASSPGLLRFLQRAADTCSRTAALCTGTFLLAEAGVLDGRRATTEWGLLRRLNEHYPNILVERVRLAVDGPIWTSAGMAAGFDLVLCMVEQDHGPDLASEVARRLMLNTPVRGATAREDSSAADSTSDVEPAAALPSSEARDRIARARRLVEETRLPFRVVAEEAGFADRTHMWQAFLQAFGMTPQALRKRARASAQ